MVRSERMSRTDLAGVLLLAISATISCEDEGYRRDRYFDAGPARPRDAGRSDAPATQSDAAIDLGRPADAQ